MQNESDFDAAGDEKTGWGVSDFRKLTPEMFAQAGMRISSQAAIHPAMPRRTINAQP